MLIETLLFASPYIVTGLLNGSLRRIGGVIREADTGRIVKHLAEAPGHSSALLKQPLSPLVGGANLVIDSLGHLATQRKLNILQSTASQILNVSQIAAGASVLNLGVSVAGFFYMHHRLNQLQNAVSDFHQILDSGLKDIQFKLDLLSGHLAYLRIITEKNLVVQKQTLDALTQLHQAIFVQMLAKLQSELISLHLFPSCSPKDAIKVLSEARIFFSDQAKQIQAEIHPRNLLLGDIAITGWAVALSAESQLLMRNGFLEDASSLLYSEVPRFRKVAEKWCQALLPNDRPQLNTAYAYHAPKLNRYISDERIKRIVRLSPIDQDLSLDEVHRKKKSLEVEFQMSYFSELEETWILTQVATSEYLDSLSELTERLESLQSFASLCKEENEFDAFQKLPSDDFDKNIYLISLNEPG
jgi:hypothetical protein